MWPAGPASSDGPASQSSPERECGFVDQEKCLMGPEQTQGQKKTETYSGDHGSDAEGQGQGQ